MFDQNSMQKWLENVAKESGIKADEIKSRATQNKPKKDKKQASKGK